jgi:hypothetical protein
MHRADYTTRGAYVTITRGTHQRFAAFGGPPWLNEDVEHDAGGPMSMRSAPIAGKTKEPRPRTPAAPRLFQRSRSHPISAITESHE